MAHFHVKKKKGRPYLYVREIARVDGRPKVVSQIYIGSPQRVAGMATGTGRDIFEGHGLPEDEVLDAFRKLRAALGVLAVLGNHEFHG